MLLYPTLANAAELSPEQRAQFERLARDRVTEGINRLRDTLDALGQAVAGGDLRGAQTGAQTVRGALGWLEGGLATFAMLSANEAPNAVAMNWFRQEMGLPNSTAVVPHGIFGLEPFHYVAMLALVALVGMLLWISRQRAQRTRALMAQLAHAATPATALSGDFGAPSAGDPSRAQRSALATGSASDAATLRASPAAVLSPPAPVPAEISPTPTNGWSGHLRVAQIFQETPQVKTFRLVDPAGGRLPFVFLPGQFLTVTVAPDGRAVRRSYTIASSPTHRDYCEITVRRESHGIVSGYLHDSVHRGELLSITAPAGRFTFTGEESDSILLVAGGVGITPMMSVVRYLTDRCWPGRIDLVYGCKADNDVIFREELEYLARRFRNLHMTLVADRAETSAWPHRTGRISKELLVDAVPDLVTRRVHVCGPGPMMDAVRQMLVDAGVAAQQIRTEAFIGKERAVPAADTARAPSAIGVPAAGGPAGAEPTAAPSVPGGTAAEAAAVVFARSNKRAALGPDQTILEAAEEAGVAIDYACRVGTCGTCRVKLLAGSVTMDIEEGLEPTDKADNIVLACQAKSTGDVTVDA